MYFGLQTLELVEPFGGSFNSITEESDKSLDFLPLHFFSLDMLKNDHLFYFTGAGTVLKAEILRRSNILAVVCKNCENVVKIWDCTTNKVRREINFHQVVTNIRYFLNLFLLHPKFYLRLFCFCPQISGGLC